MIYVIYPDVDIWNYVLADIKNESGVIIRPLNRYCHKWQIVLRKVFRDHYIPSWLLFNKELRNELRGLTENDTLLICDYTPLCLFKSIARLININVKKNLWIWNPIKNNKEYYEVFLKKIKKLGFSAATFDPSDAETFNINFYPQFYRMVVDKKNDSQILYDFYFIGASKGRDKIINSLNETLSPKYKTYLKLVNKKSDSITYSENINNVIHSRCLVDIVQEGQSGLTLRPLEALAYNKKLISNNKNLIICDFYHKENIFIIGIDKLEDIDTFMQSPCRQIEDSIRSKYDTANWIKNFMNNI